MKLQFNFRWPVKQSDECQVEVDVPMGSGPTMFNPEFVKRHQLTDKELDASAHAVLLEIAIIK